MLNILVSYQPVSQSSCILHFNQQCMRFLVDFIYLFIYGCVGSLLLHAGFSLVAASRGYSSLWCAGFSLRWLLLLRITGSRRAAFSSCGTRDQQLWHTGSVVVARGLQSAGSVVAVHGLRCFEACGIFPDQGSNPCPLHRQEDS